MMWTEEREHMLSQLWSEGLSASQIAGRLGGVTRNSVIGKAHRLGLTGKAPTKRGHKRRDALVPPATRRAPPHNTPTHAYTRGTACASRHFFRTSYANPRGIGHTSQGTCVLSHTDNVQLPLADWRPESPGFPFLWQECRSRNVVLHFPHTKSVPTQTKKIRTRARHRALYGLTPSKPLRTQGLAHMTFFC